MNEVDQTGKRLKQIRKFYKISQRQLGVRSGVSNATISQIESGGLNPTVGMLKKILQGIPISLSDFFSANAKFDHNQVFFNASDFIELSEGGVSYKQIGGNHDSRRIQFMSERYEPGAHTGHHNIQHKGQECGIILKGTLQVTVSNEVRVLEAGEAYYFDSDQPHSFKNTGTEVCELITACTPPSF